MQGLEQRADPTDAAIIGASMTEPQAFRELFARHVDPLFTYFARRLGRDAADDLTAEVFLTAFDRRARYDLARTDARRWLYGIAANLLRRHRRAEVRRLRDRAHALRRVSASGPLSGGKAAISRDRSWQSLPDGPGPVLVVGDHGMRPGELAAHALAGAAQAGADGVKGGRPIKVLPFGYVAHDEAVDPGAPLRVDLTVGGDGVVRRIAVAWGPAGSRWTHAVDYAGLGASAPIAAPAGAAPLRR